MSCISFLDTCPASGDPANVLLAKILQVLNEGGGGGGAGVSAISVNGGPNQTGVVSLTIPGGTVTSVNGDAGPAVLLDSGEIPEGVNLYFTEARVLGTDLAGFASATGAITAADTVLSAFGKTQGRLAALEAGTAGPFLLDTGDTGTGAYLFTMSANDVVPLTLTTTAGSLTTTNALAVNYGAANLLTLRNDGRLVLNGRIAAVTVSSLGHGLRVSDANTATAVIVGTLGHNLSAGVGANGIGSHLDWNIDSSTTADTRAARQTVTWVDATHATRTASHTFLTFNAGTEGIDLVLTKGQIQSSGGTAALPAFSNRNDPDTGTYFPAANTLGWSLTGVEVMRLIDTATFMRLTLTGGVASGFIATTSTAGSKAVALLAGSTAGVFEFDSSSYFTIGSNAKGSVGTGVGTVSRLVITASATVGLGPSVTPSANLDVNNSTTATKVYIYETTDGLASPANYSRSIIQPQAGNHLIRTEAAGTGTLRILQVGTGPSTGANIAGTNSIFHGGQGTGSAAGGSLLFQVSAAGGAGSGVNALATVLTITSTGAATFTGTVVGANFAAGATGFLGFVGRSIILSQADGDISLTNGASTAFGRLNFGLATNSFSAIGRDAVNGFTIQSAAATATYNDASTAASGTVADRYLFGIAAPTLTSTNATVTYTRASSFYIGGAPAQSGNVTITTPYALFVDAGTTRLDGDLLSAGSIGFFGTAAQTQQVSGANLTNNVTAGGTDNTVDNWTDLTLYATDAAAIRNAVYQLARKLKQVNDALRTYGILT